MEKVLLVDDEARILRFLEFKLRTFGYDVITATSGVRALELARSASPDLVLLDIMMPGMDGFEVLEQLRSFSNVPVIASSAHAGNADKALSYGADDFLPRPFDLNELPGRIEALLGRSQQAGALAVNR